MGELRPRAHLPGPHRTRGGGAKSVDAVYLPFHKANQFLGMSALPTFLCVDVMKRPDIEADIARYEQHLARVLG